MMADDFCKASFRWSDFLFWKVANYVQLSKMDLSCVPLKGCMTQCEDQVFVFSSTVVEGEALCFNMDRTRVQFGEHKNETSVLQELLEGLMNKNRLRSQVLE
ncbi:hypothetical protein STEG23_029340, partial [Scotinomys teguina]